MYSPFVMILGNLISGVLFLLDEYTTSVHDYLSILTGCSLIFFPQFVCNIIRYKLCIYYKLTITFLFLNLVLGLLYQVGIMVHDYSYIRGSLLFNIMGLSWVSEIAKKMFRNYASKYKWFLDGLMNEKGEVDIDLVDETIKGFFKSRGGSIELLGFELNEKIATQLKNEFIGLKTKSKI